MISCQIQLVFGINSCLNSYPHSMLLIEIAQWLSESKGRTENAILLETGAMIIQVLFQQFHFFGQHGASKER